MGSSESKMPILQKFDVEICLDKIYQYMILQRDRKINDLARKEIALREKMMDRLFSYDEVSLELMSIVSIFKYIQATKIIMRYCKALKGFSIRICDAQKRKRFDELDDLRPYIEGIIWSSSKLNLSYIKEFNNLIYRHFGQKVYHDLT